MHLPVAATQAVQRAPPTPAEHTEQAVTTPPLLKKPDWQAGHARAIVYRPAGQLVHTPVTLEQPLVPHVPSQGVQAAEPPREYLPAPHAVTVEELGHSEPAGQLVHVFPELIE